MFPEIYQLLVKLRREEDIVTSLLLTARCGTHSAAVRTGCTGVGGTLLVQASKVKLIRRASDIRRISIIQLIL